MKLVNLLIVAGIAVTANLGYAKNNCSVLFGEEKNLLKTLEMQVRADISQRKRVNYSTDKQEASLEVLNLFVSAGPLTVYKPYRNIAVYIYQRLPTKGNAKKNFIEFLDDIVNYYKDTEIPGYTPFSIEQNSIQYQTALRLKNIARRHGISLSSWQGKFESDLSGVIDNY